MINLHINDLLHGFRVVKEGDVPRLAAHYWQLRHEATGATLYYSTRDDGQKIFSVGFRTLPEDDTGVFHILEHSCLDGSEHFPLREPFVNLIKSSMASDLNAMTYEDKTVYFFISSDEQDYMNLMSVYLDAVFHPLLLSDRRIFEKEAWHLEPDGEGGVSISGVVFNEMQGRENQPDYIMWMQNEKQLFPDIRFHTSNSGGDPAAIPDLSYEQFVETYRRFYSTQNAVFYLSGDMALDRELAYIDRVLCETGCSAYAPPAPAPLQSPVVSPDGEVYYQLPETEEPAGNTHLMLTYVTEADKSEEVLALLLLCRYLADNTESPLERAVLAADVGQDFAMTMDSDYRQPMLYFTLGKTDPENAEPFRRVLLDTLSDLVREGFDHGKLASILDSYETDCRRASLEVKTGFTIMEMFLREHVLHGDVHFEDAPTRLRARLSEDERYFEHLVEKYVLNSVHWAMTKCIPSRTVAAERREAMQARFVAESARIAAVPGGYEALTAHMEAFNRYLLEPDSPEAEASVPHLSPADITIPAWRDLAKEISVVGGTEAVSLAYETESDSMAVAGVLLDIAAIPEEELFYVACLRDALFELPTESHTLPELSDLWIRLHADPSADLRMDSGSRAYLSLSLDVPEAHLCDAAALLDEYVRSVRFDRSVLGNIFANASGMRTQLISSGNRTAMRLATRTLSVSGRYQDLLTGVSAYRRYADLAARFDECADELVAGMTRVWRHLTTAVPPTAFFIGSRDGYATWKEALTALHVATEVPAMAPDLRPVPLPRRNTALCIPGQVNYCAEVFALADVDTVTLPAMRVVNTALFSRYFWDEIRAKGGAYGAGASVFRQGIAAFTSYRDPRVADTYTVFEGVPAWLEENLPTQDEVDALIVSTVGSTYCAPRGPIEQGEDALTYYLMGLSAADRRAEVEQVLGTTPADFASYAATLHQLRGKGVRTVVGNADIIRRSGLFAEDELEEL